MPLYDYKCSSCDKVAEVRHGFGEAFTGPCPSCGGSLNRVFNPAPIVFKGSGFYVTDSRGKSEEKPAAAKEAPKETATPKEAAKESKPAKNAKDPAA